MNNAKRQKTDDDPEGAGADEGEELLTDAVDEQLQNQLADVQEKLLKLGEEASDKVLEIEQQYSKLRRPMYAQRNELLKGIPSFWQIALLRHRELRNTATEDDEAVLGFCTEMLVEDFDDIKSGFRIIFRFANDNPYFSNQELVKEFNYLEGGTLRIVSTRPEWKEGYEPAEYDETAEVPEKRPREDQPQYKLFRWFEVEEEVLEPSLQDNLADILKEEIWPDPLKYYTGAGLEDEEDEDELGEGAAEMLEAEEFDDEDAALEYEEGGEAEDEGEEVPGDDDGEGEQ